MVAFGCVALVCAACSSGGGSKGTAGPPAGGVSVGVQTTSAAPSTEAPSPTGAVTSVGDLSGTWSGSWTDTSPDTSSGTFKLTWTETGSDLTGTITVQGAPCLSDGSIAGALNGDHISFGVVSGQAQVQYSGQVKGSSMSGTYSTSVACANAKGNWEASKAG